MGSTTGVGAVGEERGETLVGMYNKWKKCYLKITYVSHRLQKNRNHIIKKKTWITCYLSLFGQENILKYYQEHRISTMILGSLSLPIKTLVDATQLHFKT